MPFVSQLEPESLLAQFLAHPPEGFAVQVAPSGMPTFRAPYDLLTTADDAVRRRVAGLPLYRHWGRLLRWRTRFAGCTATEYAPLPAQVPPAELAQELKTVFGRDCALLVVKDLAHDSPLLDAASNAHADAVAAACVERGFVLLEGMGLAWVPIDFASTDDYLARLSPGRRKDIRRKLRARAGLEIGCLPTGAAFADEALLAQCYALFRNVHAQSEIQFDLPTAAFFRALLQDAGSGGKVFTYRHGGELIGWNLCYEFAGKLVDKYVGFAYPQAREHNLYFVSWMHNLEHARERGLSHYVAGWTDPQIKRYLGATLSFTRHAVYLRNPLLRMLLRRLARHFEGEARRYG
ncbi:ATP synthase subunit alpha [Frateuria sp. Soil773]|uniref:GNAT family N-acetyltransferase n=1 Tax=Frateuria sp. Soil773 TaxID=1736407 RepID=UPI0006F52BB3|nr:GNAT family N-acetyltransferase [Frateuria sp. Soil773]KRE88426.1 ATP synthase subunit alpha [Frateuria sp. Soil773]